MPADDRRYDPRFPLLVPVRFQDAAGAEVTAQAINVSRSGLFLKSPGRLVIGSSPQMSVRVPTEISGSVFSELRCAGRVVHERPDEGGFGYGIEIEKLSPGSRPLRGDFRENAQL